MVRTTLDEAISAVFNDRERRDHLGPREEAPTASAVRRCSRCGKPGHYATTCPARSETSRTQGDAPEPVAKTENEASGTPPDEIAQLDEVIALQHSALAQHRSAVRHWLAAGDEDRADAALWREDYVSGLLAQLRVDRLALCG
jgi:hypothetical protein